MSEKVAVSRTILSFTLLINTIKGNTNQITRAGESKRWEMKRGDMAEFTYGVYLLP